MAIIHLLDDDPAVTRACAFLLESLGYEAVCWEEGERFLAQADLYQVGVVLLDMRMPVLDGQAVHEALRQRGSTLAVVFDRAWRRADGGRGDETRCGGFSAKAGFAKTAAGGAGTWAHGLRRALCTEKSRRLLSATYP